MAITRMWWSSTCQRPMTVLVVIDRIALVTSPRVGGVGSQFNGSVLSSLAVSRSPKGKLTTTSHVVERDERQRQATLHRLMGMLARRLQLVSWMIIPSLQFAGNWRCSLPADRTLRYLRRDS